MQKSFLSPLDAAEEAEYLQRLEQGDEKARDVLIERNMRLVAHIAKKYLGPEEDMEDLISYALPAPLATPMGIFVS